MCLTACGDSSAADSAQPTPDASALGAHYECPSGAVITPVITVTKADVTMTQAEFQAECEKRHGVFEIEPHCGGSNGCRGFSYDETVDTYTEHSCQGANTCGGFSCIICD